jgi:hypothetical protein
VEGNEGSVRKPKPTAGGRLAVVQAQKGGEKLMLQIKEWQAKKPMQLACGHTVQAGTTAYTITLFVCQAEAVCLPQAIQACFAAQKQQATATVGQPDLLYNLWHACFGKSKQKRTT